MVVHLAAFAESAARTGLTAMTPALPGSLEPIGTYNGDNLALNRATHLLGAVCISEAEANILSWRIKKATDPNWMNFNIGMKQDDAECEPDLLQLIGALGMPLQQNDILQGESDNGGNAQLESLGMWFGAPGDISPVPIPATEVVEAIGAGTLGVDTWTDAGALTWSHSFTADRIYQIVGMSAYSATGHLARLNLTQAGILAKPGCIAGTTILAGNHIIFGNLGSFRGSNPPTLEVLANTADTAEVLTLFLR